MSLDSPYGDITDLAGARKDAEHAVGLGFSGKLCIHPKFIEDVNQVFLPGDEEVAEAKRMLAAYTAAGTGVFQYRGKMVDRPVLLRAQKVLARAEAMSSR
jgi:citrate lyase subunit beta / citryl-CoA lyase